MRLKGKTIIELALKQSDLSYKKEYKFSEYRKFRFDYAIPSVMLGIEYEGIFSSKSRHTSIMGYIGDCEKYNLAVCGGWRVLRYTAKNVGLIFDDLKKIIKYGKETGLRV